MAHDNLEKRADESVCQIAQLIVEGIWKRAIGANLMFWYVGRRVGHIQMKPMFSLAAARSFLSVRQQSGP